MKSILITVFLLFISNFLFAQSEADLIGKWKIDNVSLLGKQSADAQKRVESVIAIFKKATFDFKANHQFQFNIDIPDLRIQKANWKYDPVSKLVNVSSNQIMIKVEKIENEGVYFYIEETPIKLKVSKML